MSDSTTDQPGRWQLVHLLRSRPAAQNGFAQFVGWWFGAVILAMTAAGGGIPVSAPALIVGGVDLIAALIMLSQWRQLNPGIVVATNTVLLCLLITSGQLIAPLALVSIAVMFAAAEAGQRWWYQILDEGGPPEAATPAVQPSLQVLAIAGGAAAMATILGLFESRIATVAALAVFAVLAVGAVVFSRSQEPI